MLIAERITAIKDAGVGRIEAFAAGSLGLNSDTPHRSMPMTFIKSAATTPDKLSKKVREETPDSALGARVRSGYLWTLLGSGVEQPLGFIIGVALARMLNPSDFGLVAACLVFTEVGSTVVSASFVSCLLQKKTITSTDLSTVFVLQLITGSACALLLIGFSPFVGSLLGHEMLGPVLSVLSLNFVLLAFSSVPAAILRRNLDFRFVTLGTVVQTICYGVVSILMAWSGYGVWSLVAGRIASHLTLISLLYLATAWRPTIRFDKLVATSLIKTSLLFAGKNILDDLAKNSDYFIVGWKLGMETLGFYSRAYYLMTVPISRFSVSLGNILFPALSKIQDQQERLIHGLLKSTCLISMTTFPCLVGIQLVAPLVIPMVYGNKWLPTVLPLQIICFAGYFYSIESPAVSLINAKGLLGDDLKRQIVYLIVLVIGVLFGSHWGMAGVAWGVTVAALISWTLLLRILIKSIDLSLVDYLEGLIPGCVGTLVMAASVLSFQRVLGSYFGFKNPIGLLVLIGIGVIAYFVTLGGIHRYVDRPILNDAGREVTEFVLNIWKQYLRAEKN